MPGTGKRLSRGGGVLAGAVLAATVAAGPASAGTLAPLLAAEGGTPNGGYLVVLKAGRITGEDPAETARAAGGRDVHRYRAVLTGFSAELSPAALAKVRANPNVAYVRADAVVQAVEDQPAAREAPRAADARTNPPSWGLDRIDQRELPLDDEYDFTTTGAGVTVYVVDSGIRATHDDFGGRAAGVYNAVNDNRGTEDCHGHGTHVAGTIGGSTYGVAPDVQIRAVRVLDCRNAGTNADLIEGMDWIAANAPAGSIANLSLQNYGSVVNAAAERLIDAGVLPVFIGGNQNRDACPNAPRSWRGITVGASTRTDARWASSNDGPCVDLFAPGENITSAGIADDGAVATGWSGTSMAAPHVSGWLARYLEAHPGATLAEAKEAVVSAATTGVLTGIRNGSPDRLLYAAEDS